jgi:acetyl-CoA synthetase
VCRQPWPSVTRGIWHDEERYLKAYWSHLPGIWTHGDFAMVDGDGQWFILGRSDDVMNVAGKRLAPAEVESVMITHPRVAEAAVVGVPDIVKGEAVWAFWVARSGGETGTIDPESAEQIGADLAALVGRELGKPFTPSRVWRVAALPKTRSAKVMRRAIRAAALGIDPGDLSGAENPDAVADIRQIVMERVAPLDV